MLASRKWRGIGSFATVVVSRQADGIIVAYDSVVQQVIRVPASAVLLHLSNCEVHPAVDPACGRAID